MAQEYPVGSPKWSWPTKLVISISFILIVAGLLSRFKAFLGPLLLAFILTYLSYPIALYLHRKLKISWRVSVTLFYFLLIVFLIGLLITGGFVLIEQGQSLFNLVQQVITVTIPDFISHLSTQVIVIGKLQLDLGKLDLATLNNQILASIQPAIGQVGTLLGKIATSTASFLGWVSFIILVSYFVTSESGGIPARIFNIHIPGYSNDFRRITQNLDRIWNVFLRGQFILFGLTVVVFLILFTVFGIHYSWGLALLSGFGRFLPYVGPFIAWTALGLVAYFQGSTIFGLSAIGYVILMIGMAMLIDMLFDNYISPRFFGSTLQVHPAAVLVAALVSANLIGFVGVLLAAPVLATVQLLARYTLRKMLDMDPWTDEEVAAAQRPRIAIPDPIRRVMVFLANIIKRPLKPETDGFKSNRDQNSQLPRD